MKRFILFLALAAVAMPTIAQHYQSPIRPRYGVFPSEGNKYANLTIAYVNAPDTATAGKDSVKLIPNAYTTFITSVGVNTSVVPPTFAIDSIKDSVVYCIKSVKGAQWGDELKFHFQAANDTNSNVNKKHKIKFRNKYTTAFIFSTAADSTITLNSKGYLDMTFKFNGTKFEEIGKTLK